MIQSGYSGTPLAKKLGIKKGFKIRLVNQPAYYFDLFTDMPEDVKFLTDKKSSKNLVHYFTTEMAGLEKDITGLRNEIYPMELFGYHGQKSQQKLKRI